MGGELLTPHTLLTEDYSAASSAQIMQMIEATSRGRNNLPQQQVNMMHELGNDKKFNILMEEH